VTRPPTPPRATVLTLGNERRIALVREQFRRFAVADAPRQDRAAAARRR
jgi:hypothetical protein